MWTTGVQGFDPSPYGIRKKCDHFLFELFFGGLPRNYQLRRSQFWNDLGQLFYRFAVGPLWWCSSDIPSRCQVPHKPWMVWIGLCNSHATSECVLAFKDIQLIKTYWNSVIIINDPWIGTTSAKVWKFLVDVEPEVCRFGIDPVDPELQILDHSECQGPCFCCFSPKISVT